MTDTNETIAIPSFNPADVNSEAGYMNFFENQLFMKLEKVAPAKILTYDRATNRASVQLLTQSIYSNGEKMSQLPLNNIPVFIPSGGGFTLSFPIAAGDIGLIISADRDISVFKTLLSAFAPATYRKHKYEDGIFFPLKIDGLNDNAGAVVLTSNDGATKISIVNGQVTVTASSVLVNGDVTVTGDVTAGGISLVNHVHSGVEAAGVGTIPDDALALLDEEFGVTRVVSQYANSTVLDALQEKFEGFHDGLIAQYVICYSAIQAPESESVAGTWDVESLIKTGGDRREDSINVQIVGDFGNLRKLSYSERNKLVKAGYSNLVQRADGSYKLMDLVSFYHPTGKSNPLYRFDRDITVIGNIAYDFMSTFRDSDEWASVILVGESDITTNPAARSLKDVKAAVNTRIALLGQAGLIANYADAQKETEVEIDSSNPNRVNINPKFDLTGVGRIYDITNFIGFNFKA